MNNILLLFMKNMIIINGYIIFILLVLEIIIGVF